MSAERRKERWGELAVVGSGFPKPVEAVADLYYYPADDAVLQNLLLHASAALPARVHFEAPRFDFYRPRLSLAAHPSEPGVLVLKGLDGEPVEPVLLRWDPTDEASCAAVEHAIIEVSYQAARDYIRRQAAAKP